MGIIYQIWNRYSEICFIKIHYSFHLPKNKVVRSPMKTNISRKLYQDGKKMYIYCMLVVGGSSVTIMIHTYLLPLISHGSTMDLENPPGAPPILSAQLLILILRYVLKKYWSKDYNLQFLTDCSDTVILCDYMYCTVYKESYSYFALISLWIPYY